MKETITKNEGVLNEIIQPIHNTQKNLRVINYSTREKVDFWEKECKEHPTQKHCLVYCN